MRICYPCVFIQMVTAEQWTRGTFWGEGKVLHGDGVSVTWGFKNSQLRLVYVNTCQFNAC